MPMVSTLVDCFLIFLCHAVASASPNLFIEQITPTTIQAHWIVPPKISNENGFRIIYRGGSSGYVDVDDAFVTNTVITGFKNGANYTMSIVTTSNDPSTLPSTETESNFIQLGILLYSNLIILEP